MNYTLHCILGDYTNNELHLTLYIRRLHKIMNYTLRCILGDYTNNELHLTLYIRRLHK